jgi:hypothetical protein
MLMIFSVRKADLLATNLTLSRRRALRLAVGFGLAAVPAFRLADEAAAGRTWCRRDPTVKVDGQVLHLWVSGLLDTHYDVSGPTKVVIRVPPKVSYELLEQDAGFGKGYAISFVADAKLKTTTRQLDIAADVYVPATASGKGQPVLVEWIPDGTVEVAAKKQGTTNAWITAATKIKRAKN